MNVFENSSDLGNGTEGNIIGNNRTERTVGLMTEEEFDSFTGIMEQVQIILSILAITVNVLNICVFSHPKMRCSTRIYLISISFLQVMYVIISLVPMVQLLIYGKNYQKKTNFFNSYGIYVTNYIGVVTLRTIYCLVMFLTIERMLVTAFPLAHHNFRFKRSPKNIIAATFTVALLYRINVLLQFRVVPVDNTSDEYTVDRTEYYNAIMADFAFVGKIMFVYVPLTGILVSNVILCVILHRIRKSRAGLQEVVSVSMTREKQTTIAVMVSTCLFFLFNLPTTTNSLIGLIRSDWNYFSENQFIYLFVNELGETLGILSFGVDFLAYLIISSRYRETFIHRFIPCRKQRPTNFTVTHMTYSVSK